MTHSRTKSMKKVDNRLHRPSTFRTSAVGNGSTGRLPTGRNHGNCGRSTQGVGTAVHRRHRCPRRSRTHNPNKSTQTVDNRLHHSSTFRTSGVSRATTSHLPISGSLDAKCVKRAKKCTRSRHERTPLSNGMFRTIQTTPHHGCTTLSTACLLFKGPPSGRLLPLLYFHAGAPAARGRAPAARAPAPAARAPAPAAAAAAGTTAAAAATVATLHQKIKHTYTNCVIFNCNFTISI